MTEIIAWFGSNWKNILAIIGGVVSVATMIVKLTPTTKDDKILTIIVNILDNLSIVNTKENQKILDKNIND